MLKINSEVIPKVIRYDYERLGGVVEQIRSTFCLVRYEYDGHSFLIPYKPESLTIDEMGYYV